MLMIDCPLRQRQIEEYECYEISMTAEGLAPKRYLSDNESEIERYREICLNCPHHRED
ncbi:MAG TPA: hypothetical protein VN456_04670 [Desulfosporosinus sp.]|nr:hypothetical protein [Desulfosporosinus sp.]